MKERFYASVRIIISLSLIGFLFYLRRDTLGLTFEAIKRLEPALFVFSYVIYLLAIVISAARLKLLLYAQGLSLRFAETVYLTFIGLFFNNFLPTSIGGDVVKAYYASKKTDNKLNSFVSVFMDRLIGFLGLFILAGISLIFSYRYITAKSVIWVIITILLVILFFFAVFFNKNIARLFSPLGRLAEFLNIKEKMENAYQALNAFKDKKVLLFQALLISIVTQIMTFFVLYILSEGMGAFIPIKIVLLLMPIVCILSILPSINGLGIREGAIYFLFGPYIGYKNAFALSLVWFFMLLPISLIGGISYLLRREGIK